MCHNTPYTSPLSNLVWYISRKIADAVLNARGKVSSYKPPESGSITEAIYFAATRPNAERDAQALGWTLDRLDEEGELVQFAAGIPGFSHSTEVKESASILEMVPMSTELHEDLSGNITRLLLRAFMPGLLSDSKLLPESVRKQRVSICLEALYYLPHAPKMLLQAIVDHPADFVFEVGLSSAVLSVESWLLAERLSAVTTSILDRDVKIGAQCMATVIASHPPPGEQSRTILMRHLRIEESLFNLYLEPFDSLLLKNLNSFLINTALDVIRDDDIQHHIDLVLLTVRLAKRLKFGHASLELRCQFDILWAQIRRIETESDWKTRDNAKKLLSELSGLTESRGPNLTP